MSPETSIFSVFLLFGLDPNFSQSSSSVHTPLFVAAIIIIGPSFYSLNALLMSNILNEDSLNFYIVMPLS